MRVSVLESVVGDLQKLLEQISGSHKKYDSNVLIKVVLIYEACCLALYFLEDGRDVERAAILVENVKECISPWLGYRFINNKHKKDVNLLLMDNVCSIWDRVWVSEKVDDSGGFKMEEVVLT